MRLHFMFVVLKSSEWGHALRLLNLYSAWLLDMTQMSQMHLKEVFNVPIYLVVVDIHRCWCNWNDGVIASFFQRHELCYLLTETVVKAARWSSCCLLTNLHNVLQWRGLIGKIQGSNTALTLRRELFKILHQPVSNMYLDLTNLIYL